MPRKLLNPDVSALLPYLSKTAADTTDLLDDLHWTLARLEDAFHAVRKLGIRLDTRNDCVRVCPVSWPLCETLADEVYED